MIDSEGFRQNVGIIVCNDSGALLWARRLGQNSWQFPQGGVNSGETVDEAMYRELKEEIGLNKRDVKVLAKTRKWLRYRLPERLIRQDVLPLCVGQKQKWYMLKLISNEKSISFDASDHPEFDAWMWVNYWYPLRQVVAFKRDVYRQALQELLPAVIEHQLYSHRRKKRRRNRR